MKIAYLVSEYPAVSHTFIRREVSFLRNNGLEIDTFSIRKPKDVNTLGIEDQKEFSATWYTLPVRLMILLTIHLLSVVKRPVKYFKLLSLSMRHRVNGFRGLLWSFFYFTEALLLAREFEKRGISHLHNHFSNSAATVGYLISYYLDISWSFTLHGSADFESETRFLLKEKIAKAEFVCCVSYYGRAQAMRLSNSEDWNHISIVRCGIDTRYYISNSQNKNPIPRIVCVARLSKEKGHFILIKAFSRLIASGIKAELKLIGDGDERNRIEKLIGDLGLSEYCSLQGSICEEDVKKELANADLFVLSSLMEGVPVSIMEAMACGVPVVAPRIAGIPEIIQDNLNGFLFTPTCDIELSEKMAELINDKNKSALFVKNAYQIVNEEFNIESTYIPLLKKYQELSS